MADVKFRKKRFLENHDANKVEDRTIKAVDLKHEWLTTCTEDEIRALKICFCIDAPTDRYTRAWAAKMVKGIGETKLLSIMFNDLANAKSYQEVFGIIEYFTPKAKQVIEASGPDGSPLQVEHSGTMKWASVPPEPKDGIEWMKWAKAVQESAETDFDAQIETLQAQLKQSAGAIKDEEPDE